MKYSLRVGSLSLGVGSLLLAACGSTATASVTRPLAPNYSTVLETKTGDLFAEVRAYQHGQVLEAKGGVLRLMTPQGVSTRGGVNLSLTPNGNTAWAAVIAAIDLYVSPIYVGPIGSWTPAELSTAVAPFPGSVVPLNANAAVALVGSKAHGTGRQELVKIASNGTVDQLIATNPTLEQVASLGRCQAPVYESVAGSGADPTLLARCANPSLVALVSPLQGTGVWDRAPKGSAFVGFSRLVHLKGSRGSVAAAVVAPMRGGADRVELIGSLTSKQVVTLKGVPAASPSFAVSATREWVLIPLAGGRSQVVEFSSKGALLGDVSGPLQGQGLGISNGGHPLVIAGNPNGTAVTLWRQGTRGFVKGGSFTIPQGVNG
ncbi:MAG: hypothetical protein ACYCWN_00055 [Ferrimicrobium sp.]|jgi:hypothetical protein|uniref:Uncharacterized protein n=1 Tax=Ferrimicrobium acidiphilum TaxID=121039 RepID=A0ABV3XZH3_9ACTN